MFSHKILFAFPLPLPEELQDINLGRKKIRGEDCCCGTVMAVLI
jgi:hypothetical protein